MSSPLAAGMICGEDIHRFAQVSQRLVLQVKHGVGNAAVSDLEHVSLAACALQPIVAVKLGRQRAYGSRLEVVVLLRDGARFIGREGGTDVLFH